MTQLQPPYYAVIFSSQRTAADDAGYGEMAQRMVQLGSSMPGFLGIESVRDDAGSGITVSYWSSLEAIAIWREQAEHKIAQSLGKAKWYQRYSLRICRVEREYQFERPGQTE